MKNIHSSTDTRVVRVSGIKRGIPQNELSKDPKVTGRLSALGLVHTLLVEIAPFVCFVLSSALLIQHAYCGVFYVPDHFIVVLCRVTAGFPQWLLALILLESVFQVATRLKLSYMQRIDPLEVSLEKGGIMTRMERQQLFDRVMAATSSDITSFIEDWFFGTKIREISEHELRDFLAWALFDSRNQEHLTVAENEQLDSFLNDVIGRIKKQQTSLKKRGLEIDPENVLRKSLNDPTILLSNFRHNRRALKKLEAQQRLLQQMLTQASGFPEAQLAQMMRKVTKTHTKLMLQKHGTKDTSSSTVANPKIPTEQSRRFQSGNTDPILGVRIPPLLFFQLPLFLLLETIWRITMWRAGFQRRRGVDTTYYFHPGSNHNNDNIDTIPVVFLHGIGIGHVPYLPLIFEMLKTGRPVFLPEIESVSAFRPWIFPCSAHSSHQVALSLSTMLASHGFDKATFAGHSYGSTWMAYMAKFAPSFVAAFVFLDPVCFCIYNPHTVRSSVYSKVSPAEYTFLVLTDMMVNWTVQRVNWPRANLFVEDILGKPCAIFLSEKDSKIPSRVQEDYLRTNGAKVKNFEDVRKKDFESEELSCIVFSGCEHGQWVSDPFATSPRLVECIEALSVRAERKDHHKSASKGVSSKGHAPTPHPRNMLANSLLAPLLD